jgi:addiction module RelE/StbE family toxin
MWKVHITKKAQKEVNAAPDAVKRAYAAWLEVAKASGSQGLLKIKGFRDHALKGEWKGARSSYLSDAWRVIYQVDKDAVTILIVRVSNHDYS